MSLPKLKFLIKLIWVNKTYDEDTKVSNYHMRFRGPSDTKEELDLISLVEGKFVSFFNLKLIHVAIGIFNVHVV